MPSTSEPSDKQPLHAAYYDGVSAVRRDVVVNLRVDALDILAHEGEGEEAILDQWLYDELEFSDQGSGGTRVAKVGSAARLVFDNVAAFDVLRRYAPEIHTRQKRARHGMILAVVSTVAILVGTYFLLPYLTVAIVSITPLSYEVKLGQSISADILEALEEEGAQGICAEAPGAAALSKLVQGLSGHTRRASIPYDVRVLDVKSVNAIALPGGYIYVFRGLLEKAESESELAGVLAHEMAHVDMRHPMHGLVRSYGLSLLSDMMFGGGTLGGVSNMLMLSSYSREAEEQADAAAIETLEQAGLSTEGMAVFFERLRALEEESDFGLPGFLSTHPEIETRVAKAQAAAHGGQDILTDMEWAKLRAICN